MVQCINHSTFKTEGQRSLGGVVANACTRAPARAFHSWECTSPRRVQEGKAKAVRLLKCVMAQSMFMSISADAHHGPVSDMHGVASARHSETFTLHLQAKRQAIMIDACHVDPAGAGCTAAQWISFLQSSANRKAAHERYATAEKNQICGGIGSQILVAMGQKRLIRRQLGSAAGGTQGQQPHCSTRVHTRTKARAISGPGWRSLRRCRSCHTTIAAGRCSPAAAWPAAAPAFPESWTPVRSRSVSPSPSSAGRL